MAVTDGYESIWQMADTIAEAETKQWETLPYGTRDSQAKSLLDSGIENPVVVYQNRTEYKDSSRSKHIIAMLEMFTYKE